MAKHAMSQEEQETMRRLAGALRLLRLQKNVSVREFAERVGVDHSTYFRLENGTANNTSIFIINKLAKALDLTVDELMNFSARECPVCGGRGWIKNGNSIRDTQKEMKWQT